MMLALYQALPFLDVVFHLDFRLVLVSWSLRL